MENEDTPTVTDSDDLQQERVEIRQTIKKLEKQERAVRSVLEGAALGAGEVDARPHGGMSVMSDEAKLARIHDALGRLRAKLDHPGAASRG